MRRPTILIAGALMGIAAVLGWRWGLRADGTAEAVRGASSSASRASSAAAPAPENDRRTPTTPQASASLDQRPFAEVRAELERLANAGDAHAALRLGRTLAHCNGYVPLGSARLEEWVVDLAAGGASVSLGGREQTPEALLEMLKLGAAQQEIDCKNVSGLNEVDAPARALRWIERSAALGNADAQAMYGSLAFASYDPRSALIDAEGVRERKQRAIDHLQRSLAQGDALALLELFKSYSKGTLHAADAAAAYAHLYAYSLTPRASELAPALLDRLLASGAEKLDAQSLQRAREDGSHLAACCGGTSEGAP